MENSKNIKNTAELEELLSRPNDQSIEFVRTLEGDMIFLGVTGKIGPSLALMARRACDAAGIDKKIIGVSRFREDSGREELEKAGIETIPGDLLEPGFIQQLPRVKNVIFLAGMKFGSLENAALTWAINSYMPGLVAEHYKKSRIVAYSTGCVYPFVPPESEGSKETDVPGPIGEYAQSCLGRERLFEHGSLKHQTKMALIRLNYAVELRYGVLVDIAMKVKKEIPIDLSMGYFNIIWQGDANNMVLQSLGHVQSPPNIINITGFEILSVKTVAEEFGKRMDMKPVFSGRESETALLSNPQKAYELFGPPEVSVSTLLDWITDWILHGKEILNKPTKFEVRDGKY